MKPELKKVAKIFGAWLLMSVVFWLILPSDWKWFTYVPIAMIPTALVLAGIAILLKHLGFFKPRRAMVNHHQINACMFCPFRQVKDNPVNYKFPILKCSEKGMKTIYRQEVVQWWCPHAI